MMNVINHTASFALIAGLIALYAGAAGATCIQPSPVQTGLQANGPTGGKILEAELALLIRFAECSARVNSSIEQTVGDARRSREKLQNAVAALIATSKDLP